MTDRTGLPPNPIHVDRHKLREERETDRRLARLVLAGKPAGDAARDVLQRLGEVERHG